MTRTFQAGYTSMKEEDCYTKRNFETTAIMTSKYKNNNSNILSRIRNAFVQTLKTCKALPKIVVVVVEDDLINFFGNSPVGANKLFGTAIDWLMTELTKTVDSFKEFIPFKAKKDNYPHFLWIMPVINIGMEEEECKLRDKFNECLMTIAPSYKNTSALKLMQVWDTRNHNLFMPMMNRISKEGEIKLWRAIDKTIRYCDAKNFQTKTG